MACGCSGTHRHPRGAPVVLAPGEAGLLKLQATPEDPTDVWGEVTNIAYLFSVRPQLYVDTRDAVFLLGEEFVLV